MKIFNRFAVSVAAVALLAGCSSQLSPLSMVNRAQPVGSPYNQYLANEYRLLANRTSGSDSEHFAKKGLAAVDGIFVAPEMLEDWSLKGSDAAELADARATLITTLENGGRDMAPDKAAMAQSHFDCWVMNEEKAPDETGSCKETFYTALKAMQDTVAQASQPPVTAAVSGGASDSSEFPSPITGDTKGAPTPLQQASFLVFFDWDKYNVNSSAKGVLDTVADDIKSRKDVSKIHVVGHADTSGGETYNMRLSVKRAEAVRKALVSRGLPAKKIQTEGHGESDLLVKTPDNTREPQNRRAAITLE